MKSAGMIAALLSALVSATLFAVYFVYWTSLPDYVWEVALGCAVVAVVLGLWTPVRRPHTRSRPV